MVIQSLRFQHVVNVFNGSVATARDHRNKCHIYLITEDAVYKHNGLTASWEALNLCDSHTIRRELNACTRIPCYYALEYQLN